MKHLSVNAFRIFCIVLIQLLSTYCCSQPGPSAEISGKWSGNWKNPEGYEFDCTLSLTSSEDKITGFFIWKLKKAPVSDKHLISKIGHESTEYIIGRKHENGDLYILEGIKTDDPNGIIAMDIYIVMLSVDGKSLFGFTRNNGNWKGTIKMNKKL